MNKLLNAAVVELADALDSKSSGSDTVSVRPRPAAPKKSIPEGMLFFGASDSCGRIPRNISPKAKPAALSKIITASFYYL